MFYFNRLAKSKLDQLYLNDVDLQILLLNDLSKRGFTLVEILIVLALIGIVAGLAMSNLGEIFGGGKVKAAQTCKQYR